MNLPIVKTMDHSTGKNHINTLKIGIIFIYVLGILTLSPIYGTSILLVIGAIVGGYMAVNIGANDVANNLGPAVGAKALTMGGAILIAIIFESAGAFIAGGDVVGTVKGGIINIESLNGNVDIFIWAMIASLLSAALWLNLATYFKAPVSTTHSIVGSIAGAGIAAGGIDIVNWATMTKIVMSWVISPGLGGILAAIILVSIKFSIVFREDKIKAARFWVPIYVAFMTWAFSTYLIIKGLKKIWPDIVDILAFLPDEKKPSFLVASIIGGIIAAFVYFLIKFVVSKNTKLKNNTKSINLMFKVPLIFAAALLSFAHGANDVANAIGPLAAINDAITNGGISAKASIPIWIMSIGAIGIAIGLALYGPALIKTVGTEITELNHMRAFSVGLSAAITVIIASQLGLPVSSTHIAIGAIFGVGFLREYLQDHKHTKRIEKEEEKIINENMLIIEIKANIQNLMIDAKDRNVAKELLLLTQELSKEEEKFESEKLKQKCMLKKKYVKRSALVRIVAAWIITVPASGLLSAIFFFTIRGMML